MTDQVFGRRERSPAPLGSAALPAIAAAGAATCRGCGAPVAGRFCQACGQAASQRDSLLDLGRELVQRLTRYDRRVWGGLLLLIVNPGRLSREWNEGRRAGRLTPLHMALFATFIFCLVPLLAGWRNPDLDVQGGLGRWNASMGGLKAQGLWYTLGMTPLLTAILALLCVRRGATLYNHAVVALHEVAWMTLVATVSWLDLLFNGPPMTLVLPAIIVPHLAAHLIGAYRLSWPGGIARAMAALLLMAGGWAVIAPLTHPALHESPRTKPWGRSYFTQAPRAPADGA